MLDFSAHRRRVASDQQQKAYNRWIDDMNREASKHDMFSGLFNLVSMWNPVVGIGLDVINRGIQQHNMPDDFDTSGYLYTSSGADEDYSQGSKDALTELQAHMYGSLMKHLGTSVTYHGMKGFGEYMSNWGFGPEQVAGGAKVTTELSQGLPMVGSPPPPSMAGILPREVQSVPTSGGWDFPEWPDSVPRSSESPGVQNPWMEGVS
jgi:hypothetical protein